MVLLKNLTTRSGLHTLIPRQGSGQVPSNAASRSACRLNLITGVLIVHCVPGAGEMDNVIIVCVFATFQWSHVLPTPLTLRIKIM